MARSGELVPSPLRGDRDGRRDAEAEPKPEPPHHGRGGLLRQLQHLGLRDQSGDVGGDEAMSENCMKGLAAD